MHLNQLYAIVVEVSNVGSVYDGGMNVNTAGCVVIVIVSQ